MLIRAWVMVLQVGLKPRPLMGSSSLARQRRARYPLCPACHRGASGGPVGSQGGRQDLKIFTRKDTQRLSVKLLGTAEFVPMVPGMASAKA